MYNVFAYMNFSYLLYFEFEWSHRLRIYEVTDSNFGPNSGYSIEIFRHFRYSLKSNEDTIP